MDKRLNELNDHNVILTGYPGTGKSYTVAKFIDLCLYKGKKVVATASTGKAAVVLTEALEKLNVHKTCVTIHKFFGILDGRFSDDEMVELMFNDERYEKRKRELLETNVLIIDEVSMISKKTFEQVEHVSRAVKNNDRPFGGMQVVLCGDFYQLPPVPSPHYGDDGSYVFSSDLIDCFHHVDLTTVHRQRDEDLSRAISEVARGQLKEDSTFLLRRLARPLPPGDPPIHLYGNNLDVDIHNARCLMDLEGEEVVYKCTDEGDTSGVRAKSELHLKENCPVILNVNLSDELVNGLCGFVERLETGQVFVHFPSINKTQKITPYNYTKYCVLLKRDIGRRVQIPLDLGFALTVHKSQGLTMRRVTMECRNMRQYGQLTVALSRTTCKKDLQVKNFNPSGVRKPPQEVVKFYERAPLPLKITLECCRHKENKKGKTGDDDGRDDDDDDDDDGGGGGDGGDNDDGDGGDNEPEDYDTDDGDDADEIEKILDEIEKMSKPDQNTKKLPEDINVTAILGGVKNCQERTEQQKKENAVVKTLLENQDSTHQFITYLFNSISALLDNLPSKSLTNKEIHLFYREYNSLVCSPEHRIQVQYLFGHNLSPAHDNIIGKIATKLRNYLIHAKAEPCRSKLQAEITEQTGKEFTESEEGRSKIRYIAGWCISSLLKKSKKSISGSLYNKNRVKETENFISQRQFLESLRADSTECEDQHSLKEIFRKQNVGRSLFIVNDAALAFFFLLDTKIRTLQNSSNLNLHRQNFGHFSKSSLQHDAVLRSTWGKLFMEPSEIVKLLFDEVVFKYVRMSLSQFRKEYMDINRVKKKAATRKQITCRSKSKEKFNFQTLLEDKTRDKLASHKRLQAEVLGSEDFLVDKFNKSELTLLCKAYGLKAGNTKKKMQDSLKGTITDSIEFQNTSVFQESSGSYEVAGTSTSSDSSMFQKASGSSEVAGTSTSSDSITEKQSSKVPVKGKRKCSGKGKGLAKRKKILWPCGICEKDASFDSVGCDRCETWFHRLCLKIDSLDELPDEWFCQECTEK